MGGGILLGKYYKRKKIIKDRTFCVNLTNREFFHPSLGVSDYRKNYISGVIRSIRSWPDRTLIAPELLAFWSEEE